MKAIFRVVALLCTAARATIFVKKAWNEEEPCFAEYWEKDLGTKEKFEDCCHRLPGEIESENCDKYWVRDATCWPEVIAGSYNYYSYPWRDCCKDAHDADLCMTYDESWQYFWFINTLIYLAALALLGTIFVYSVGCCCPRSVDFAIELKETHEERKQERRAEADFRAMRPQEQRAALEKMMRTLDESSSS